MSLLYDLGNLVARYAMLVAKFWSGIICKLGGDVTPGAAHNLKIQLPQCTGGPLRPGADRSREQHRTRVGSPQVHAETYTFPQG